jgi:hypothetical protein
LKNKNNEVKIMKKGQITMESLLLYGAAILVVLLAIAALTYFGVFDLGNLLPQKCNLEDTGIFKCEEWQLVKSSAGTGGTLRIVVKNIAAKPVDITRNLAVFEAPGYVSNCAGTDSSVVVTPGATQQIDIPCGTINAKKGDRVKGSVTIVSKYTDGTLTTTTIGQVSAKVTE